MPDIGQIKGTNIKRGNSGLDPKTWDVNKELLDTMRIIARQEIANASRDITKNALVRSVNTDGTVNITLEGKEFNKIPNYTVGTVKTNDVVKVTYPQNQASNMYVSGGTSIDNIKSTLTNNTNSINSINDKLNRFHYVGTVTAGSNTVTITLSNGGYLFVSNLAHWQTASGIWYVSINNGGSKAVNIVTAEHCSLSVSGKVVSWQADSWGSEAIIYELW